jgi:TRAP-type C4-dicarboxylate transport system permease large subunit
MAATSETTTHMGALVLLMSLSIALGGVFERSEVMDLVPQDLGSTWATMGLLVFLLVIIGMTMDPYGAVILVSATLAEVAYSAGIEPAHFWMVVLVAFELGYLTPPVALNHLLTRQVVGADEVDRAIAETTGSFWMRHERIMLPITVMGTALVLVAFVPLLFSGG